MTAMRMPESNISTVTLNGGCEHMMTNLILFLTWILSQRIQLYQESSPTFDKERLNNNIIVNYEV